MLLHHLRVVACRTPDGHTVSHVVINPSGSLAACSAGRTLHLIDLAGDDYEQNRSACSSCEHVQLADSQCVPLPCECMAVLQAHLCTHMLARTHAHYMDCEHS